MRTAWPAAALASIALWGSPAAAQIVSVVLHGPTRDFGHFVGDLLTSTAIITVQPGTVLDPRSLPPVGPASAIADVRQVEIGGTQDRIEIAVTYQSFFAPEQVSQADIPGYTLIFLAHGARLAALVPSFTYTASPFRHDLQPSVDPAAMRPDHASLPARAPGAIWAMAAGAVLMAAGLLALIGRWPVPSRRPFAVAASQLAQAARAPAQDRRETLLVLHRAFDATAGRRVFAEDIEDFLQQHPGLLPLRTRIQTFFAASRQVFFAEDDHAPDITLWVALCRDLARAERLG